MGNADVLALLDHALHKRGMRLVVMNMGSHCASYMAEAYPSWRARDAHGQPIPALGTYHLCLNTPFSNFLLQEFRELLPRYQIEGLYVEGLYGLDCYCDYSCAEFKHTYGYNIPRDVEQRQASHEYGLSGPRHHELRPSPPDGDRETSPRTILMPCPSRFDDCYADLTGWGRYANGHSTR